MRDASPLRYPGGKWRIYPFFNRLIELNKLVKPVYVEAYAGGASLALNLLFSDIVSEIVLNDIDPTIHAFWKAVTRENKEFLELLKSTPITPEEWQNQKNIYSDSESDELRLGFATFFLNRTNYSGIMNGGMIGGRTQEGDYKLDARFNKLELQRRIMRIATFRSRIHLFSYDAMQLIKDYAFSRNHLLFLDPPYYNKGQRLYHNAYATADHATVNKCVLATETNWVVSYDDVPEIRQLYRGVKSRRVSLRYSARKSRSGSEVLFFCPDMRIPSRIL